MASPIQTAPSDDGVDNFFAYCAASKLPADSLERFIKADYVPQPKQVLLHAACRAADEPDAPNEIGYGGALGGGKTHGAFAQITIDDCQRFDNLKCLFLRKVGKYAKESIDDLRRAILGGKVEHEFANNNVRFPNQSRVIIGAYQYEKDIDNYLSLEYDIILIEQAEQISGKKIDLIKTRNRSSKGFRPRMYYTFNPGGLSHAYLKEKFIKPYRNNSETNTKFIFANYQDNAALDADYKKKLDSLGGWQKAAWRDGDWDVFAGQFFSTFSYDRHVLKPNQMPQPKQQQLTVWCSLDYGYKHWMMCYLFCEFDGVIYCLDELARRKTLIGPYCADIHQMLAKYGLTVDNLANFYAGADVFGKKGDTGESYADEFAKYGIYLRAANTNREQGAGRILQQLGDAEQHIEPTVKISSNCSKLIETLPILEHNPDRPNDILKIDADDEGIGGDDSYDGFRYGINVNNSIGVTI